MMRFVITLLACLAIFHASPVQAHVTPDSQVTLSVGEDTVTAQIIIPASEYAYASGNQASNNDVALEIAARYLISRTSLTSPEGEAWNGQVDAVSFAQVEGPEDLLATMTFTPPAGADSNRFTLRWSAVIEGTGDHFATILVRESGLAQEPRLVGLLRQSNTAIDIDAGRSGAMDRFFGAMRLGVEHILGGLDHLAFLLALILAAPMVAERGAWRGLRGKLATIKSLALLATGFTVGHSLTLIGVASAGITLPGSIVEPAIAATVLIAAIHALRPIFARREMIVATIFGLIHGLGFAGFVQETDAEIAQSLPTLLGFNVGIELVQIALILLFIPALFFVVKKGAYNHVRIGLASMVSMASIWWIVTRTGLLA